MRILLITLSLAITPGCSNHPADHPLGNLAPHVRISGGPREGTRAQYNTRIYLAGWDDDGVIDHYEYALDPPDAFTHDEINAPEQAPGVVVARIPSGFQGDPDTLRVSKGDPGARIHFDYLSTQQTDQVFQLEASHTDSVISYTGRRVPGLTASDVHTVYVRAMDTEGAYSDADHVGFTAWTYTPTSWISYPNTNQKVLYTGGKLVVRWGGFDPDPVNRAKSEPVGYYYKLVDLHTLNPPLSVLTTADPQQIVFDRAKSIPWTYLSAETTRIELYVNSGEYLFALRAVDELGGVEPFVEWRRGEDPPGNAFLTLAHEGGGRPQLTLTEPNLGSFSFRGDALSEEAEAPTNAQLRFRWVASAEEYGGSIAAYSWGLDIADLDQETGWSKWGLSQTSTPPLMFGKAGVHVLYVRAKDTVDSITIGAVVIRIYEFTFDREVLFVDDYLSLFRPKDRESDAFWQGLFENSGRFGPRDLDRQTLFWDTGGEGDRSFAFPSAPPPSLMGRYKLIVWDVTGAGLCGRTGLFYAATKSRNLRLYLAAGGQFWLDGNLSLAPLREGNLCPDPTSPLYDGQSEPKPAAETTYPQAYVPGDFAWDLLKLHTDILDSDKGRLYEDRHWYDGFVGAKAWNPAAPLLGDLDYDGDKVGPIWTEDGVDLTEAVFGPMYYGEPGFRGKVDSLYAYQAAGPVRFPGNLNVASRFQGKLCAIRWSDPDPDREQGRIMWFGFPFYYAKQAQAQDVFNHAIDWFREENPLDLKP